MVIEIVVAFLEKMITFFETNGVVTFFVFVIALFLLYKLIRLGIRLLMIVGIGAAFPFIMNYLFNWGVPTTFESIIFYATSAAVIYLFAVLMKGVFGIIGKILSPISNRRRMKKMEHEIEEDLEKRR